MNYRDKNDGRMRPSERLRLAVVIRDLSAEGLTPPKIAQRLQLNAKLVRRILGVGRGIIR
jgi:hypothetical protein